MQFSSLKIPLSYSYLLRLPNGEQTMDWGRDRVLVPADYNCEELLAINSWNSLGFVENAI